jgi:hypothetical protein
VTDLLVNVRNFFSLIAARSWIELAALPGTSNRMITSAEFYKDEPLMVCIALPASLHYLHSRHVIKVRSGASW